MLGNDADLVDIQPDNPPPNLQQPTSFTIKVVCHTKGFTTLGDMLCSGYAKHDPRSKQNFCDACFDNKRLKRNAYTQEYRDKKKRGDNKIQKIAHDEVVTVPSQVHPKMKEEATSATPLVAVIGYSNLIPLIINQKQYKVMKLKLPLFSQLLAARSVVYESVKIVSKEKSWAAVGLYGKKQKTDDKALGYVRLFGGKNDWKVDIVGLAEKTQFFSLIVYFQKSRSMCQGEITFQWKSLASLLIKM